MRKIFKKIQNRVKNETGTDHDVGNRDRRITHARVSDEIAGVPPVRGTRREGDASARARERAQSRMDRRSFLVGAGAIVGGAVLTSTAAADMAGSGTESDPYQIETLEHLAAIDDDVGAHYQLVDDIDASDTVNWTFDDGEGWEPIWFEGSLYGDGHEIRNLYSHSDEHGWLGLFGADDTDGDGVIQDVHMVDVDIHGSGGDTGALVGECFGEIRRCSATGTVKNNHNVGGLVGRTQGGSLYSCAADCTVEGEDTVGGLLGFLGFVDDVVEDCYSLSTATGGDYVGGLLGGAFDNERIARRSFAAGSVSGDENVGGVVGGGAWDNELDDWEAEYVYWDVEATGQDVPIGEGYEADGVTGLTTDQMTGDAAAQNMEGFDFV